MDGFYAFYHFIVSVVETLCDSGFRPLSVTCVHFAAFTQMFHDDFCYSHCCW